VAGDYKVKSLEPTLNAFLQRESNDNIESKISALRALLKMADDHSVILQAGKILSDETAPVALRKRIAAILGESPGPEVNKSTKFSRK
jgi:hypothetical protein